MSYIDTTEEDNQQKEEKVLTAYPVVTQKTISGNVKS